MHRRLFREQLDEGVRVVVGDLAGVHTTHPLGQLLGARERDLHRDLLIQHHPDQQRKGIGLQKLVGDGILH